MIISTLIIINCGREQNKGRTTKGSLLLLLLPCSMPSIVSLWTRCVVGGDDGITRASNRQSVNFGSFKFRQNVKEPEEEEKDEDE